jgi:uncharacterized Zn ribbon protein
MNNLLDATEENEDILKEQKKIIIKHRKIKRSTRTYLYNIDNWMDASELKLIKKPIQKKLATSAQVITDDEGVALTFNGDHTLIIKELIIKYSGGKVTEESFE